MSTALIAVDAHVAKAKEYRQAGEDYFARCGKELRLAKEGCKTYLEFNLACARQGISQRTAQRWLQFEKDPSKAIEHRKKQVIADKKYTERLSRDAEVVKENIQLPSPGELHEATRGMKAMIRKASLDGEKGDWRSSHQKRTVAFQHFKKLLSASNLPALMGMTADDIIELIRTL